MYRNRASASVVAVWRKRRAEYPAEAQRIEAWRLAALADGWQQVPTYRGESVERAATLTKDGFKALLINRPSGPERPDGSGFTGEVQLNVWGPDGLAVLVPKVYDFAALTENLQRCEFCQQVVEKTVRIGWAGRACPPCREKHAPEIERPGWTN